MTLRLLWYPLLPGLWSWLVAGLGSLSSSGAEGVSMWAGMTEFHKWILPSSPMLARVLLEGPGCHARAEGTASTSVLDRTSFFSTSHTVIFLSRPPLAKYSPVGSEAG